MSIEANEVTQPASAAVALQTFPTTSDHSPGGDNAALENCTEPTNPIDETAVPAPTITKIASKPSKSRKHVTFIASVVSDSGTTPTGTVMIKNGTKMLWAGLPLNNGITSVTQKMVEVRGAIFAIYSGDQYHTSSSSDALVQLLKANAMEAQTFSSSTAQGELTSCVAKVEDVERETALTGEITKLWSSHELSTSSIRRTRTELEGLRYQLGERLSEYKSLLVRTGRNGKWMGFLRQAHIPRTTADRLVTKWQQPVKRTTGAFKAPSNAEIGQMVKKLALKLERVLTTPDSVALFMTELAAALRTPESAV